MDAQRLLELCIVDGRQNTAQPLGEHAFPCTRGTDHHQTVFAHSGYHHSAFSDFLTYNVGIIEAYGGAALNKPTVNPKVGPRVPTAPKRVDPQDNKSIDVW